jgi:hypothetical protein
MFFTKPYLYGISFFLYFFLKTHVENFTDERLHAQVDASIQRCIDIYDDADEGYVVQYHREVFGGIPAKRQFALCGIQLL